jgi:hypothetical protein
MDGLGTDRRRSPTRVLFVVLLAAVLAAPALATTSHRSAQEAASVPDCTGFSHAEMARLIDVGSLDFQGRRSDLNACAYVANVSGDYSDLLQVSVRPATRCGRLTCKALFLKSEQLARQSHGQPHRFFRTVRVRGALMFIVSGYILSSSLPRPCPPGQTLPEFGPPLCNGEPTWYTYSVQSYGALKPRGPKAFVAVGLANGPGGVGTARVISLNKEILSGKIR